MERRPNTVAKAIDARGIGGEPLLNVAVDATAEHVVEALPGLLWPGRGNRLELWPVPDPQQSARAGSQPDRAVTFPIIRTRDHGHVGVAIDLAEITPLLVRVQAQAFAVGADPKTFVALGVGIHQHAEYAGLR